MNGVMGEDTGRLLIAKEEDTLVEVVFTEREGELVEETGAAELFTALLEERDDLVLVPLLLQATGDELVNLISSESETRIASWGGGTMTLETSDFDSVLLLLSPEIDREELGREELTAMGAPSGCLEETVLAALGALSSVRFTAAVEEEELICESPTGDKEPADVELLEVMEEEVKGIVEEFELLLVDTVVLFESVVSSLLAETTGSCDSLVAIAAGVKRGLNNKGGSTFCMICIMRVRISEVIGILLPSPLLQGTDDCGELISFSGVEGDLLSSLFEMVMICSASDDGVVFSFITAQDPSVEEIGVFWSTVLD